MFVGILRRMSLARLALVVVLATFLSACFVVGDDKPNGKAPEAVISDGEDTVSVTADITFDGVESYDPDNYHPNPPHGIAGYLWTVEDGPPSSEASFEDDSAQKATLAPDVVGDYTVNLVVTDEDGLTSEPATATFLAVDGTPTPTPPSTATIEFEVTWDIDISDVDIHLVNETENGQFFQAPYDCYYANMTPDWGPPGDEGNPVLDVEDVNGFGPEHIAIANPEAGPVSYIFIIHYYSDDGVGGTNATAKIFIDGVEVYSRVQNLNQTGRTWEVARLEWPSETVTPIDNVYDYTPF